MSSDEIVGRALCAENTVQLLEDTIAAVSVRHIFAGTVFKEGFSVLQNDDNAPHTIYNTNNVYKYIYNAAMCAKLVCA